MAGLSAINVTGRHSAVALVDNVATNVEGLALGGPLPVGRRQLYLMSDDNNGATQITRFYSLAVDLH